MNSDRINLRRRKQEGTPKCQINLKNRKAVECEEYFDNRSDADCDQDGFIPNEEMKRLQGVRDALAAAKKEGF